MSAALLMARLLEIEKSAGCVGPLEIRAMAIEAQNDLLALERQYGAFLAAQVARDEADVPRCSLHESLPKWPEVSSRLQAQPEEPSAPPHPSVAGLRASRHHV